MKSTKSVDESHFLPFAAIVSTRDWTEISRFHIRDTMITRGEMSGKSLGVIVVVDRRTVFTKLLEIFQFHRCTGCIKKS